VAALDRAVAAAFAELKAAEQLAQGGAAPADGGSCGDERAKRRVEEARGRVEEARGLFVELLLQPAALAQRVQRQGGDGQENPWT
jgi:hypothetical protein